MVVESILPNKIIMILILFYTQDNVFMMESKYAIFPHFKVTKTGERSGVLGETWYSKSLLKYVRINGMKRQRGRGILKMPEHRR